MNTVPVPTTEPTTATNAGGDALARLFPSASARGQLMAHWAEGRFLVEHGETKDLEERIAQRFPTPEALADFAPDITVSVYGFRDGEDSGQGSAAAGDELRDLHTFPAQAVSEAVPLYHAGHTIICWRMADHIPEALERGTGILEAIGLPHRPVAARGLLEPWDNNWLFVSLVYTPAGCTSGLGMHFDRFDGVVVQLRGTKRWRVGRHPYLEHPLYNEESGERLGFPPSLPRLGTRSELVTELEDIEMRQGSALLLPRGTYHTTLADDEPSLSVGYHFALPTWAHVVLAGLERRLLRDPVMRRTPFGAFAPTGPTPEARDGMTAAVERTREALSDATRLLEEDLLGNLASHHQANFRLAPDAAARLSLDDQPVIANYGGHGLDVELPAAATPLCRWLLDRAPGWFVFDSALTAAGGQLSPQAVWNLLQEGVEAGVLERRWGRVDEDSAVAPNGRAENRA